MTAMTQLRKVLGRKQAQGEDVPAAVAVVPETNDVKGLGNASEDMKAMQEQQPSDEVQHGVKLAQALTLTWKKNSLVAIFIFMRFLYLTNGFQSSVLYSLTPYAASDFESHSLLPVIDVVSSAMTASAYIPLAKILDLWGRAEGFLLMVLFATLGMILLAASQNLATYCAAMVFWQVGWNRGLAFAFTSSPYMITAFAGPKAAEGFLNNVSWRWGFGCFSIALPIVAVSMYGILKWNTRKAKKKGILIRGSSGRSFVEIVRWGLDEFDVLGVVLFACGLVTFLPPFSLASTAPNGWKSAYVIAMIITGFVVLALFLLNELFLAPKPFFRF
ncbi:Siderophore iron transporter mirB [Colletotrichum shisoi]|uniref:Siderophore iron transporter mirB n=1 Tax=Colletotrichum shisoi TaxID=2078593 RepID=A0A5Q4BLV2_9PEZI|nr:Siderophore iron transporter mirB [Colletotrichum shisoi]